MEQCANHVCTFFHCRDKAAYEVNLGHLMTVLLLTVDLTVIEVSKSSTREWCSVSEMCNASDRVPVIWSVADANVPSAIFIAHGFILGNIGSTLVCIT